jgi:IS30 family transposase
LHEKNKQLTVEQSYQIEALLQAGFNQTKIAAQLGSSAVPCVEN